MTKNAYIHVPFCKQKCKYCSFISFTNHDLKEQYLIALKKEIQTKYKSEKLNTLYFGGGTPSLLSINQLEELLYLFDTGKNTEITLEINPETVNEAYISALNKIGINRLSIGCQSFDDEILKNIGRIHNSEQVKNIVKLAQKYNFNNISLDFIYGLPNQTRESFTNDLKTAINLGIQHISLYGLKIEEGCYFYNNPPQNIADNDTQADMYLDAINILKQAGFEHYEISNFSRQGFNSKHNLNYWENNEYYGFGVAAHGYLEGIRYSNNCNLEEYIKCPLQTEFEHLETYEEQLEEEIFLGLRKCSGLNISHIDAKYSIDFEKKYSKILSKYLDSEHLIKTKDGYKLSDKGILVSNTIMAEFLN